MQEASKEQVVIRPQAGFQEMFVRSNVDVCFAGGVLNPQPIDSLIATPNGFVPLGKIKAGDIICDTDGGTQKVNFVVDKGWQPCVEFELRDGRAVQCALSHHWLVRTRHGFMRELSAQEIIDYHNKEIEVASKGKRKRSLLKIPMPKPISFADTYANERTVHPYVLGFILGDGCMTAKASKPFISTLDKEVIDRFNALGYHTEQLPYNNPIDYTILDANIKTNLKKLGVWGHTAPNKFIPKAYKYAPIKDRLELLKGLFDADGCCTFAKNSKSPRVNFVTVSKQLASDVMEIIYSLGGRCGIYEREPHLRDWGDKVSYCLKSYTLFPHIYDDRELFFLQRKKNKCKEDSERCHKLGLGIVSYRILPPKQMRCINVDNDKHLYLTDNYVVTCNCGKSFAAILSVAEPSLDSKFRAVFLRNNLDDTKAGGSLLDGFREVYGDKGCKITESGNPYVVFPSGARVDVTHVSDQSRDKVRQRFKGRQYDLIYFDEMTGFNWESFVEIATRNRGTGKWTGKIRGTTNPDRDHWLRKFLDWYIGPDGFIREDRAGKIRYFYIKGETVDDVVWGDTKEEVYAICKPDIDRKLKKINGSIGKATYEDLIQSFTFYLGRMSENKASIGNNKGYIGAVAMAGGRNAEQLLEGNWNVSAREDLNAPIPSVSASHVFLNDPARNGDGWVTADLADTGTDNFLALAWDGLHIIDKLILMKSTPRMNAERLEMFAADHNIANNHIIYDAVRGTYINDYIEEAIPYVSYRAPMGLYGRMARQLKDECYMRLVECIKREQLSVDESVAMSIYQHQNMKEQLTFQAEFLEECAVVRFKEVGSGKMTLLTKKEMNAMLGKGRSMDLLDPCAMRMLPLLEYPYGEELTATMVLDGGNDEEEDIYKRDEVNIYDEVW